MITHTQLASWKAADIADAIAAGYNAELIECEEINGEPFAELRADDEDEGYYEQEDTLDWSDADERGWAQQDRIDMFRAEY